MGTKTVASSRVYMTQLVLPTYTNALDTIFGGTVMSWIDVAAAVCAQRHCNKDVVTASMDDLQFLAPIRKGWVVNLMASCNYTAKSSMEIGVRVEAENPKTGETFHTSTAYMTFVALDSNGKPSAVPPLQLETDEDRRRFKNGELRRTERLKKRKNNKP